MRIRFLSIRAFAPAVCLVSLLAITAARSFAQQTPPAAQTPAPATTSAPASTTKVPDYPDPRSFFIGIYGLYGVNYSGPDIRGGKAAGTTFESLYGIGQPYRYTLEGEAGIPVTRTGMLYADFERYHGDGSQVLTKGTFLNSVNFAAGDQIQSKYHMLTGRLYLDDLLYPHKFPVARLRFRSIWGIRYINATTSQISPTEDDVSGTPGASFGLGTYNIFYPEFGLGMEYAIAPHVLFKTDAEGFAFPHKAVMYEGNATLSVRRKNLEFMVGVKTLHFKTNPQKENYVIGDFVTPFVGLRWHF